MLNGELRPAWAAMVRSKKVWKPGLISGQVSAATKQAQERRSRWTKLPYGIPLCVGFLLYLLYMLVLLA